MPRPDIERIKRGIALKNSAPWFRQLVQEMIDYMLELERALWPKPAQQSNRQNYVKPKTFFIWWLSDSDLYQLGLPFYQAKGEHFKWQLLVDDQPLPEHIMEYCRERYRGSVIPEEHRIRRLSIPVQLKDFRENWSLTQAWHDRYMEKFGRDYIGIVFHPNDLVMIRLLPGTITDFELNDVEESDMKKKKKERQLGQLEQQRQRINQSIDTEKEELTRIQSLNWQFIAVLCFVVLAIPTGIIVVVMQSGVNAFVWGILTTFMFCSVIVIISILRSFHVDKTKSREKIVFGGLLHLGLTYKMAGRKASYHRHRAKRKGREGAFTGDEWVALCSYYHYTCLRCKRQEPSVQLTPDHVVPLACGGSNVIDNIQPLCFDCNSWKQARTIDFRPTWKG